MATATPPPPPPASIAAKLPPGLKRSEPHAFNPATDITSQTGKVFLITGSTSGIGLQTAIELAKHAPRQIWLSGRAEKGAVGKVKEAGPEVDVRFVAMDLADFESVKNAARMVREGAERIDVLMLSAGMMGGVPGVTAQGHERQFGTNHIGHALLFKVLLPLLLATTPPARIITTSSRGHKMHVPLGGIHFDTLHTPQPDLSGILKYTQSKLANAVYARQIALHYPSLVSVSIHPEDVATQLFSKGAVGGGPEIEYLAREIAPMIGVSVQEGAKNGLWAATAAEGVVSGGYYEPVGKVGEESEFVRDEAFGERLWVWTQKGLEGIEI